MTRQPKRKSRRFLQARPFQSLFILGFSLSLLFAIAAPAQAGIVERIRAIFQPNSELGSAQGSRRGGGTRDICQTLDVAADAEDFEPGETDAEDATRLANDFSEANENQAIANNRLEEGDTQADDADVDAIPAIVAFAPAAEAPDPDSAEPETLLEGKTLETHPRFGLYVPFSKEKNTASLEFSIADTETFEYLIEPFSLDLPQRPGLVTIQLPKDETSSRGLQPDRLYEWTVALRCETEDSSRTLQEVSGLISLASDPELLASNLNDYNIYLERELWYDMVAQLTANRDRHPDIWYEFLAYFGLDGETVDPRLILQLSPPSSTEEESNDDVL